MPRAKRQTFAEVTIDRPAEDVLRAIERLPAPSLAEIAAAEQAADRYIRRFEKARARWAAMTPDEQREWVTEYVRQRTSNGSTAKASKVADLPMLYAIVTLGEKAARKARSVYEATRAAQDAAEQARKVEAAERRAAKPRPAPATRPTPALPEAGTSETPRKTRRRRRGPAVGVVAVQMPDGRLIDMDD